MFFLFLSLLLVVILMTSTNTVVDSPYFQWLSVQNYFISISYLEFLVVYIIVLKLLTSRLKHFFPSFYRSQRKTILVTNFLMIGSISARIIISLVLTRKDYLKLLSDSLHNGTWFYPINQLFVAIIATFVPLTTIIFTLMHATNQKSQ